MMVFSPQGPRKANLVLVSQRESLRKMTAEIIDRYFRTSRGDLRKVGANVRFDDVSLKDCRASVCLSATQARMANKLPEEEYAKILSLRNRGHSKSDIAKELGHDPKTVKRVIAEDENKRERERAI